MIKVGTVTVGCLSWTMKDTPETVVVLGSEQNLDRSTRSQLPTSSSGVTKFYTHGVIRRGFLFSEKSKQTVKGFLRFTLSLGSEGVIIRFYLCKI